MEILKKGNIPTMWQGKCQICESVISMNAKEIRKHSSGSISLENCPVCQGTKSLIMKPCNSMND